MYLIKSGKHGFDLDSGKENAAKNQSKREFDSKKKNKENAEYLAENEVFELKSITGGGTRTHTRGEPERILNPSRLPFRHSGQTCEQNITDPNKLVKRKENLFNQEKLYLQAMRSRLYGGFLAFFGFHCCAYLRSRSARRC